MPNRADFLYWTNAWEQEKTWLKDAADKNLDSDCDQNNASEN